MTRTCPHCGADLFDASPAFCPACRAELPPPGSPAAPAPAGADPLPVPEAAQGEVPDERTVQFWRALFAITPRAYVTRALVAVNVVVFVLMVASGASASDPSIPDLIRWGADYGPRTLDGEWWRTVTCMFVHIGIIHVAMNMWVLTVSGRVVERMLGNVGFLLMYVLSGLGGSLASLCWHPELVSAGASGAVFGVYGALLGLLQRQGHSIPTQALGGLKRTGFAFVGYNLIFGLMLPNIDMAAHVGGLATGYLCGLLLSRPLTPEGAAQRTNRNILTAAVGLAAVALGFLALSAFPPRAVELARELANCEQVEQRSLQIYNDSLAKLKRGEITDAALADVVARDVLPEWREARKRLAALQDLPSGSHDHVEGVLKYMRLREESWQLFVEAVREGDPEKANKAGEKNRLAEEAIKRMESR